MNTTKKVLVGAGAVAAAFLAYGFYLSNTPDGEARSNERRIIESCWQEQKRPSLDPAAARLVAGSCERLEAAYRDRWHRDP